MEDQRKIIHIDADSFYASVETRENPALAGKPIAVGGRPDRRGVIATANYEARKFGVHSAMASSRAMALCPTLLILPPRFELYRAVSGQFHDIFREYTELIEPLSLDEAYLDVASDWNKPDGMFTIAPGQVAEFVLELPVSKINGVGRVTADKLRRMGVETCGDLQQLPLEKLVERFGKYGRRLHDVARGVDKRRVQTSRVRKSISVERTYARDIDAMPAMVAAVDELLLELAGRFGRIADRYFPTKRVVKIKYQDFTQTTLEEAIGASGEPWNDAASFHRLVTTAWPRGAKPVRLLGAGLRLQPRSAEDLDQLSLFEQA
jgi:DNA polymerase-4